jgi:hypothetical protein
MTQQPGCRCKMAGAGFHSIAKLRAQIWYHGSWQSAVFRSRIATTKITTLRIGTDRSLNLRADCHRPDLTAGIPCYLSAELGNTQCTWERFTEGLFPLWETAVSISWHHTFNRKETIGQENLWPMYSCYCSKWAKHNYSNNIYTKSTK